ncbi:MAG: hypothetical protein M3322_04030 [Actinomycetota bacterium]|nr:hypothetical protein [Actinomycetota bacterium]
MTATTTPVSEPRDGTLARLASLGGLAYVVLFIVGTILAFAGTPQSDAPPGEFIAYYGDEGHRTRIVIGWILVMLGVLCFLWFLARLRDVVAGYGAGFLSSVVFIGGIVYAATTTVAISVWMGVSTMSDDTFRDRVFPDLIHAAGDAGYVTHAAGAVGATSMIVAASLAALLSRRLPAWAGWLGIALGIIGLFSIVFFPQAAIAIWLIAASVILFLQEPGRRAVSA